ncbi:ABC transporter substrate-binding protein [Kineosporia sp. R_H_3]|uniref:ABC transporter substrate-binding protein n=1 Tax=Kineosporia sp. R_H_3 TaxID=1961848 RepID=UPI000B4A9CB8|nr:ABC transporter substrate-binding protein [Kineosporia sp. R_H_3]
MKTTRLIGASTFAVAALVLSACGGGSSAGTTSSDTGTAGASSSAATGGKNITLMVGVKGDPFYVSMECGAKEAAAAAGATLTTQGPDKFDATLQNPLLDAVAASKPDALLVAPNDVKASVGPLKKIQDAGSKVVLVDTVVDDASIGVSRIATDNKLGGVKAAEALQTLGVAAKGKVLVISTNPGVSSVDARVDGFKEKAAELGYTLVSDTQYSNNEAAKAAQIMSAALAKDPDIAGVFATNLFTAQGVATGVKQAGQSGKVKVVGFDAGPDQIKQLEAGDVQALVAQKPFDIGVQGVEQAIAALSGGSVTANIQTESLVVTKDNMAQPDVAKYIYKSSC